MIIVVSDTGPIHYLLLAGCVNVLPKLYDRVMLPGAVLAELRHHAAPRMVQDWSAVLPPWTAVQSPTHVDEAIKLDRGEAEAICLAEELKATLVLLDERKGPQIAIQRGLQVTGTLGILATASRRKLIHLPTVIDRLHHTNIRIDRDLLRDLLADEGAEN